MAVSLDKLKDENMQSDRYLTSVGVALLRLGISFVFLYFGINQLISPKDFIAWLPSEASIIPLSSVTLIILNGSLEVFLGIMLLLGLYTRISAVILSIHLFAITYTIGYTQIGVRDFGLSVATLALALTGPGVFSVSNYIRERKEST